MKYRNICLHAMLWRASGYRYGIRLQRVPLPFLLIIILQLYDNNVCLPIHGILHQTHQFFSLSAIIAHLTPTLLFGSPNIKRYLPENLFSEVRLSILDH